MDTIDKADELFANVVETINKHLALFGVEGADAGYSWLDDETVSVYIDVDFKSPSFRDNKHLVDKVHYEDCLALSKELHDVDEDWCFHQSEGSYWLDGEEVDGDGKYDSTSFMFYISR